MAITGVTGSLTHGGAVTINGNAFGVKSPVAPAVWDPCDHGQALGARWSGGWPTVAAAGAANAIDYRVAQRGISMPHSRTTKYLAGCHNPGTGADAGYAVLVWKNFTVSLPMLTFMSFRQRFDDAWVFGLGSPADDNTKTTDYSIGTDPYNPSNWYTQYAASQLTSPSATPQWGINDDGASLNLPDDNGHNAFWNTTNVNPMSGLWAQVQQVTYHAASGGVVLIRENGLTMVNYAGPTDLYAGTARNLAIGGYARSQGSANNWRYFADLYLDYTLARVELWKLDGSVREPQGGLLTWSDSQITLNLNLGALGNNDQALLVVVDANGNGMGYQVSLGTQGLGGGTMKFLPTRERRRG